MKHIPKQFDALTGQRNILFYALLSQVIIPDSWNFGLIVQIPSIMSFNVKDNACVLMDEEWLRKPYFVYWTATVVVAMVLMAGLYSRIVYTLWFKLDPENQLTFQQRVSINKQA